MARTPSVDELQRLYDRADARPDYGRRIGRMIAWLSAELRGQLNPTGGYLVALARRAMEREQR